MRKVKGTPCSKEVNKKISNHLTSHNPSLVRFFDLRDKMADLRIPVKESWETFSPEMQVMYDTSMKELISFKNELFRRYTALLHDWNELKKYALLADKGAGRDAVMKYLNKHEKDMEDVELVIASITKLKMRLT